jgi:assimilatory nitrate reductase catalytic subunit
LRRGQSVGRRRLFADGAFYTASGKANFIAIAPPHLAATVSEAFPLLLNTGRMRDQWHTMTRTGLSPRLGSHSAEPILSVHPHDAAVAGLVDSGLARVESESGFAIYRVSVTSMQAQGSVFAPIHWTDETASAARTGALVHAFYDPYSGQPDGKATPVSLAPLKMAPAGFLLAPSKLALPRESYWAWERIKHGYAARLDTNADAATWLTLLRDALPKETELVSFSDASRGIFRAAFVGNEHLVAAIFLGPSADIPRWTCLQQAWEAEKLDPLMRRLMLSGKRLDGVVEEGPNVCACFGVPQGRIIAAIKAGQDDVKAIGRALKAGTNCGSCIPELERLLMQNAAAREASLCTTERTELAVP